MMSRLPFDLQRRLQPSYPFLVAYSATGLVIVGAPAPGWDLGLTDLRLPEANLQPRGLLQLGLLGS
jgi:hypothetical protein